VYNLHPHSKFGGDLNIKLACTGATSRESLEFLLENHGQDGLKGNDKRNS
jgi:hypothetical protein